MRVKAGQRGSPLADSMQPQDKPNLHYPKMKYHWTKDPAIVNNADDGAALGGGWADTPAAFAPYRGPRPPRTADQKAIKWVDDWPVPAVMSDHRQGIKIELLRADVAFWKSPDTPDAQHTAMRRESRARPQPPSGRMVRGNLSFGNARSLCINPPYR